MSRKDSLKRRDLYKKSDIYRASRIKNSADYNRRHAKEYKEYQAKYRMKKRIEKVLTGYVIPIKMQDAINAVYEEVLFEIGLDRKNRNVQVLNFSKK